jgi:cytochrome c peroxidase
MRYGYARALRLGMIGAATALAIPLMPSPAFGQAATTFGSNSGITCPGGNVICNGSINFLTTELFFEPETPPQTLKDSLPTWNEVEYMLDNPYFVGGGGNAAVIGAVCRDGSGLQPINEQGFPTYCTGRVAANAASVIFNDYIRRPAFGVTHPVAGGAQNSAQTAAAGLPPIRMHPINYNAPNGNEQRVLNPNFAGKAAFNNTGVCYVDSTVAGTATHGPGECVPPNSVISVSTGASRLDPTATPEIDYDVAIGAKPFYCQNNPEPVPLNAPFNTAFDSESLNSCGSDPGEPGASMPYITLTGSRRGTAPEVSATIVAGAICCEDNLGLPIASASSTSWYSVPAVPAGNAALAVLRQIRSRALCTPGTAACEATGGGTGASVPIQPYENIVDPGVRGTIVALNPLTGVGGLKKPTLRAADVCGTGLAPNYLINSAAPPACAAAGTRTDPTGADIQFANENDFYGLYAGPTTAFGTTTTSTAAFYQQKQAARLEAARLGKALFWDMQVGSDGVQSCGSCHAHAAADNRTKNQINPNGQDGIRGNPTNFTGDPNTVFAGPATAANYDLKKTDFPFHKLINPEIAGDPVCSPAIVGNTTGFTFPDGDPQQNPFPTLGGGVYTACDAANIVVGGDTEEVASSMGVHFGYFADIPAGTGTGLANAPGATSPFGPASNGVRALIRDQRAPAAGTAASTCATAGSSCDLNVDPIPGFAGTAGPTGHNEFRRVEPRNTPTIDLAAFNFDNFWDARARHDDNGGSVFGPSDPQSHVFVDQTNNGTLTATRQLIKFSSIASLAKGPALSKFEMSYLNRNWAKIGKKLLQAGVTPLANQLVDPTDSVLGPYSNQNGSACAALPAADRSPEGATSATALGVGVPGLCITYSALIRHAYYPALWQNTGMHLNGCYTDTYGVTDAGQLAAINQVHPNQCGATGYPAAASIEVLNPNGTLGFFNNDPFDTYVLNLAAGAASPTDTNQFRQIEGNFSLFWGQSINAWASLLVPDDTPLDKFLDANPDIGMATGETGEPLLVLDVPMCGLNGASALPAGYVRDFEHSGCLREVGNFKRDRYNAADIVGTAANPVQNDTTGHPRMSACIAQLTFNGETGTRICTRYVPAGGTRDPNPASNAPDPLLGMDIFFGSNLSLKNPEFRSARCGACHNAPTLTDHTTSFTHKWTLVDAAAEFAHDNPLIEPLMEPLSKQRVISAFHLESETNGPGQDAIERKVNNESIVPAPLSANGNCTTGSCTGYSFPDAITYNPTGGTGTLVGPCTGTVGSSSGVGAYCIHADLGTGPVAGGVGVNGQGVPFTSFAGSFFDNGVYNIGVRPCVADYQGNITGACEDTGRGNVDAFGWPMSLAAVMLKDLGGPAQQTGTAIAAFDPTNANLAGRLDGQPCTPYCATGGLFNLTGHDQLINSGYNDDPANPLIPGYIAAAASHIPVGDSHPQLDEACGPVGACVNTLSDVANAEGFPEMPFDARANLSEVNNNSVAPGDAFWNLVTQQNGAGVAEQGTWPVVNRVSRMGNFKAPQLREVELTGPYFHNGGKLTLRQVVDFYVRGGDFPVTNSTNRDFNILNLNAEIQSNLSEAEKVALVDFLLELTDDRVALEKGPFDHPQLILPLDGTAPESDGTINRDAMLTGCTTTGAAVFGPGQQLCAGNAAAMAAAPTATGPLYLNVPAVGAAGNPGGRIPNFLGIAGAAADGLNAGRQRLVDAAAFCGANITSQYCH